MSKPYIHAKSSARRFGGAPEDYMDIHELMDESKSAMADVRHRAVFHSAYGIYIVQKIFGQTRVNSEGKTYSVRDIAEQHIMEDLGFIPTLEKWMSGAPIEPWMMGRREKDAAQHKADVEEAVKKVLPARPLPDKASMPIKLPVQPLDWPGQVEPFANPHRHFPPILVD